MVVGLLRLILAYSVVTGHSDRFLGFNYLDASIAVWAFFVISGFFMALILDKKYDSYSLYISNRYLRLFPTYIVVFIITVIFSYYALIYHNLAILNVVYFFENPDVTIGSKLYVAIVNIVIFGQNMLTFMGFDFETMSFYFNPDTEILLNNYLFIEQAWTLSVEFMFYLIAPFLVKLSNKNLIILGFSSLLLRIIMHLSGFTSWTWNYHFFPTLLFLFILGMLSYRLYMQINSDKNNLKIHFFEKEFKINSNQVYALSILVIAMTFSYNFIPDLFSLKAYLYIGLIALALPVLFTLSGSFKYDKIFGDLSYPVYIAHISVVVITLLFMVEFAGFDPSYNTFYSQIVYTIILFALSMALVYFVERPVNKYRQSRISAKKGPQKKNTGLVKTTKKDKK